MRCLRCGRAVTAYARQVDTTAGSAGWGPTCARLVFGPVARHARPAVPSGRAADVDPLQVDWVELLPFGEPIAVADG